MSYSIIKNAYRANLLYWPCQDHRNVFCLWFCCCWSLILISYIPLISCWVLEVTATPEGLLQHPWDRRNVSRNFTLKGGIIEVNCSEHLLETLWFRNSPSHTWMVIIYALNFLFLIFFGLIKGNFVSTLWVVMIPISWVQMGQRLYPHLIDSRPRLWDVR